MEDHIESEFDTENALVIVRYNGVITRQASVHRLISCIASEDFRPDFDFFIDLANLTDVEGGYDTMRFYVSNLEPYYAARVNTSKTAILAPNDLQYGTARMYQMICDGVAPIEIGVFRTRAEVACFLDRDPVCFQ